MVIGGAARILTSGRPFVFTVEIRPLFRMMNGRQKRSACTAKTNKNGRYLLWRDMLKFTKSLW
jgi:hypothetical protein